MVTSRKIKRGGEGMGLEEGRKEMDDKKGGGRGHSCRKKEKKKEKKGELKPDTQELRPEANSLLRLQTCQPGEATRFQSQPSLTLHALSP